MRISVLSSVVLGVSMAFMAAAESARALTLAKDGKAGATIVLAKDAVIAERTAVTELATCLKAISGAEFAVFWSWIIQLDIDSVVDTQAPDVTHDIWANIKFEGPAFPHGKPEQKNAICVERVVLVRSDANAPAGQR